MDITKISKSDIVNKRTGLGAGIGALFGFFFAGPVGALIGAGAGGALANVTPAGSSKKGVMTPDRKMVFESAMNGERSPDELDQLADAFAGEGFDPEADLLRKRAALSRLPPEIIDKYKDIYRKAMASDNPAEIREYAGAFQSEARFGAAKSLRDHADAVEAAHVAGKSCKPLGDTKAIDLFGDKLAKAVVHFGPESPQAKSAAANFVRARGMQVTPEAVQSTLAAAQEELDASAPPSAAPGAQGAQKSAPQAAPAPQASQAAQASDEDEDEDEDSGATEDSGVDGSGAGNHPSEEPL